jgi:acyl carrier protein
VVLAREDTPGEIRLVAYVVASAAQHVTSQNLRDFLKEQLPEYMIPSAFVFLDSLPLTPSGKIDRRALPAPDGRRPELAAVFAAPRTSGEELLAKIWREVLKLEKVGIHDNFFDLGGHSLLATQAVSRMREALQKNIPLRNLFEAPTISELALLLEKSNRNQGAVPAPPIVRASRDSYRVKLEK